MKYTTRIKSIISEENNLEHLYTFKNFPVFIGCTDKCKTNDLFFDMEWDICKDSGIIQLKNLLPLDIIYSEYHCEAVGSFWEYHHKEFSKVINKYSDDNILEIGGGNGFLARKFLKEHPNKQWTIIEPTPKEPFKELTNLKIIRKFFDNTTKIDGVNSIIHSHVLEHSYEPEKFLKDVASFLSDGQYQIFSFPNLYRYLKNGFTNVINFEHTMFLTEDLLDFLLSKNKFEIVDKVYFEDHSIFYVTKKNSNAIIKEMPSKYIEHKQMYLESIENYKQLVNKYNIEIKKHKDVFLFGGHVFSQLPLHFGLDETKINCILDNSDLKENKRLYGTNLFIKKPDVINSLENPVVIVNTGSYKDEIIEQLKRINNEVILI